MCFQEDLISGLSVIAPNTLLKGMLTEPKHIFKKKQIISNKTNKMNILVYDLGVSK